MKCFLVIYKCKKPEPAIPGERHPPTSLKEMFTGPATTEERSEYIVAKSLTTAAVTAERACQDGEWVHAMSESEVPCRVID